LPHAANRTGNWERDRSWKLVRGAGVGRKLGMAWGQEYWEREEGALAQWDWG